MLTSSTSSSSARNVTTTRPRVRTGLNGGIRRPWHWEGKRASVQPDDTAFADFPHRHQTSTYQTTAHLHWRTDDGLIDERREVDVAFSDQTSRDPHRPKTIIRGLRPEAYFGKRKTMPEQASFEVAEPTWLVEELGREGAKKELSEALERNIEEARTAAVRATPF